MVSDLSTPSTDIAVSPFYAFTIADQAVSQALDLAQAPLSERSFDPWRDGQVQLGGDLQFARGTKRPRPSRWDSRSRHRCDTRNCRLLGRQPRPFGRRSKPQTTSSVTSNGFDSRQRSLAARRAICAVTWPLACDAERAFRTGRQQQ